MKENKQTKISGEERKAQIKKIALHLFAKNKFQATTMAAIARVAGVSEPLVYQHFKNKKELLLVILTECHDSIVLESKKMLEEDGEIPVIYARLFKSYIQNITKKHPDRAKIFILAASVDDDDIRAEVRRFDRTMNGLFATNLEAKAREKNIFLKHNPEVIARILFCLILDKAFLVMIEMDGNTDKILNESIDLIFSQITE